MNNTEIIYKALNNPVVKNLEEYHSYCMFCNKEITKGVKYKKTISTNFTNFDVLKNIKGTHVCKACSYCMKLGELRKNSFISDKSNLYLLKKNDIEQYLFNLSKYVKGEFVVGITQTFKKHNAFRCRVNKSTKEFYIRMEDVEFVFNVDKLKPLYKLLNEAYMSFSKEELQTGFYKAIAVNQFGFEKFQYVEKIFNKHRGSQYFNFLIYIMNSERRNKIIKERRKKSGV